ncbi:oxoglutarate 3-dioxygenase [Exophiala viscosa]|uniref:Oxoglutarate 3-dioxygenase n=1 Tax=Exophiala viscosa TaxID=2486360 RepID=A0AAN6DSJ6_9EURO|nr:oxoglutarate 3-dioxygenase [Exophiala viscosa]
MPASKMPTLPVIDFSPYVDLNSTEASKQAVAQEIDRACREVGFFYLSNHGVDVSLLQQMIDNARTFFDTASDEEKDAIKIKPAGDGLGDLSRGFQRVDGGAKGSHEAVDIFRPVDNSAGPPYEIGLGENQWPTVPKNFREVSERYVDGLLTLATQLMRVIAIGLGVDEQLFLSRIDKSFWNLRILGYKATDPEATTPSVSGIGEHTDFGILTLLLTDPQKNSLQVWSKSGEWMAADPIPGCFVINLGDMLSKWTDGQYVSTKHRVLHNSSKARISVPFFFDPNMDAHISPVLPLDGSAREDEGILYREKFLRAMQYTVITDPNYSCTT